MNPFTLIHSPFANATSASEITKLGNKLVMNTIIPLTNAIFYGSAFMSFMAVAYCPAYLEDYIQFIKEKHNGLYGATEMTIANFLIGIPYLFGISMVFSVISYWLSNFQPTAQAFFTWVFWIFLDLLAAEGLVVFMTIIFSNTYF